MSKWLAGMNVTLAVLVAGTAILAASRLETLLDASPSNPGIEGGVMVVGLFYLAGVAVFVVSSAIAQWRRRATLAAVLSGIATVAMVLPLCWMAASWPLAGFGVLGAMVSVLIVDASYIRSQRKLHLAA